MIFDVYKVAINSTTPRTHYALFVEAHSDGTGHLIHVLGDVQSGYACNIYSGADGWGVQAEYVSGFLGKELIGRALAGRLTEFVYACESLPPPGVQMNEYGVKIDKDKPWYRDGEWVEDLIRMLKDIGLMTAL